MIRIIRKSRTSKILACFLALSFLTDFLNPMKAVASGSGPNQSDFAAFGHASISELVNTSNGDFTYNIPLLDIEGYPINITYNPGAGMDQEASWVGLGWTLNPGALNRTMRGVPDDFNGDKVEQDVSMKANNTFGADIGANVEAFGLGDGNLGISLGVGMGVFYNNYKGLGTNLSADISVSAGNFFSAGVGINANSQEGMSISPNVSLSAKTEGKSGNSASASVGAGTTYNTRSGLGDLSLSLSASVKAKQKHKGKDGKEKTTKQGGSRSTSATIPIGTASNFPSIQFQRKSSALELRVKLGGEIQGAYISGHMKGYLMTEEIDQKNMSSPAYGYLYAHHGQSDKEALHDFNRANDGMVSKETPNLPLTNQTYDIFNASAQGLSSMFRAHRSDVGTVYDNEKKSSNSSIKVGVEVGFGSYFEAGANINSFKMSQTAGRWTTNDGSNLGFIGNEDALVSSNYDFEEAYFSQSGEGLTVNETYYNSMGGDAAVRLELNGNEPSSITSNLVDRTGASLGNVSNLHNSQRTKRGVAINYLNAKQAKDFGLEKTIESYHTNVFDYAINQTATANHIVGEGSYTNVDLLDRITQASQGEHHISEVTVTSTEGKRFVYGIPSYTRMYEERSFNMANTNTSSFNTNSNSGNAFLDGMISFGTQDNSINNNRKKDGFFMRKSVPDYATSYLLTAALSTDYVDVSGNGPSVDDLGNYTKFNYSRIHANYDWKQPYEAGKANFNAGFRSEKKDDRANYTKGSKEIWYLHSIETKNYIAEFEIASRADAIEANLANEGGPGSDAMYSLSEIRLYARKDKEQNGSAATPIKTVKFTYSYKLCKDLFGSGTTGKLTLDEIGFEHGKSTKAWLSPYKFYYGDVNHDQSIDPVTENAVYNSAYAKNSFDRWGTYKEKKAGADQNLNTSTNLSNSDFPYVNNYPNNTDYQPDVDAAMWAMHTIKLPSGGSISIDYESDDYAYVQDKKAMQMMTVAGMRSGGSTTNKLYADANNMFGGGRAPNLEMVVNLPYPIRASSVSAAKSIFMDRYMREEVNGALRSSLINKLYYKFAVNTGLESDEYDFVTGYADIQNVTDMLTCSGCNSGTVVIDDGTSGTYYSQAVIKLKPAKLKDNERGSDVHPISKATWQMVRTYLYKLAFPAGSMEDDNLGLNEETIQLLFSFMEDIRVMLNGVNGEMRRKGIGQNMSPNKSFVRLHNPVYDKNGGGHRVKQILMADNWENMNPDSNADYVEEDAVYGKMYDYTTTHPTLKDGNNSPLRMSSGVASYEPQIGGDESPFRRPIEYELKRHLYANDILYAEAPFGEVFFPNPSVVYSKVRVRDYTPPSVNRTVNGTGESVFEYYTAYDFPVDVSYTPAQKIEEKPNPLRQMFSSTSTYELAMSQGYSIVLNDMHGKEKATVVYGEGKSGDDFISKVEYFYKTKNSSPKRLDNRVNVLTESGGEETLLVNVDFDMVHDSKQTHTHYETETYQVNVNTIVSPALGFPLPIPTFFPQFQEDTKRHKMSVLTKVVQKYGILEKTIAEDQQARIESKNEVFDKETGQVLLTRVTNQYDKNNDHYSMTYPAHWAYDRMGPAYKNLDKDFIEATAGDVVNNFGQIQSPYDEHFVVGDEVMVYTTGGAADQKYWVLEGDCKQEDCGELSNLSGLFLIDRDGQIYMNPSSTAKVFKIIRSGRRNIAGIPVSNFTAKQAVLGSNWKNATSTGITILSNTAQEFTEQAHYQKGSNRDCDDYEINPFIWGVLGNWRPTKNWVYNVKRNYSPGNLKNDGYFSMIPYWRLSGSDWVVNASNLDNWQVVNENTLHHASGFTLENRNEIGTYVAQLATLNNTAIKATANNARYREIVNESFEDFKMLDNNYDNGYWTYLCSQNRVGLYQGGFDQTLPFTDVTAHTGNYCMEIIPGEPRDFMTIFFDNDQDLTMDQPSIPYSPQGWERLKASSQNFVNQGDKTGFVVSYWRRLGTELNYDVNKRLKEQYDPVNIDLDFGSGFPPPDYNRKTQKSVIIDGWQKVDEIITFSMPSGNVNIDLVFNNTSSSANGYLDDVRVHPLHSNMMSNVYDMYTNRKVAELDANNYATFYEYNEEGIVVRVKKETERGIVTVQESRSFLVRN